MVNIQKEAVWKKAHDLISSKYGKNLSYRSLKIMNDAQKNAYSQGDDLVIPLKIKNYDLGDVIVSNGSLLNTSEKTDVVDLIKFLIEPKVYSLHLQEFERNHTTNFEQLSEPERKAKVINLFESVEHFRQKTLSQVIHLKAKEELTRQKVALKIHEMSGKSLFVPFSDIHKTLKNVDDFKTLSDITVYIDDIEKVSEEMLSLLQQHIDQSPADDTLFLIGSNLTMTDIDQKNWSESFKKDMTGFYFDIDKVPYSQQTNEEVLELLFFRFDDFST